MLQTGPFSKVHSSLIDGQLVELAKACQPVMCYDHGLYINGYDLGHSCYCYLIFRVVPYSLHERQCSLLASATTGWLYKSMLTWAYFLLTLVFFQAKSLWWFIHQKTKKSKGIFIVLPPHFQSSVHIYSNGRLTQWQYCLAGQLTISTKISETGNTYLPHQL